MKDGYYLSTYLHIDPLDHLLNMNQARHDQNAALFRKSGNRVSLVRYWEIERSTGIKQHACSFYDKQHAENLINRLLSTCGLKFEDMNEVWGTPQLQTCDDYHSLDRFSDLTYHSVSHLFSAVMLDSDIFYQGQIIGLAVDDSPDLLLDTYARKKPFYSGCVVRQGRMELFPISSPGPLWLWAMRKFNLQAGTLMALATASKSMAYMKPFETLAVFSDQYDVSLEAFFEALQTIDRLTVHDAGTLFNGFDTRFTEAENKISMVMKAIQAMSLKIMVSNLDHILDKYRLNTAETTFAIAGGFALNCPTNSRLMHKYGFAGFVAPPCVNDGGISLGMGLYAFYKKMNGIPLEFKLEHPFYGKFDYNLDKVIGTYGHYIESVTVIKSEQAVNDLIDQPIIWFDAAAEIGPRALGHRSILGDPRSDRTKDQLNEMKRREWWRPVAPIMIVEELSEWFENAYPSPLMLHTFSIRKEKQSEVPAIVHLDGTARVQTIDKRINASLYAVIQAFRARTGIPMLCNTSLNDKDEPIIDTLEEALNFALRKGLKVAYLNGTRVELRNHSDYKESQPLQRSFQMNVLGDDVTEDAWNRVNPHGIPTDILKYYKLIVERNPERVYDLTDAAHAKALTKEIKRFKAMYHRRID